MCVSIFISNLAEDRHLVTETQELSRETPKSESESCSVVSSSLWPHGLYSPWNSPGQNTGVGRLSLFQGIFPTQGLNWGLPHCGWILYQHCGWILYQLSHQGSPRILEWLAYPFFSGSSQPRNWIRVSCIAGRYFTSWAVREAPKGIGKSASERDPAPVSCPSQLAQHLSLGFVRLSPSTSILPANRWRQGTWDLDPWTPKSPMWHTRYFLTQFQSPPSASSLDPADPSHSVSHPTPSTPYALAIPIYLPYLFPCHPFSAFVC